MDKCTMKFMTILKIMQSTVRLTASPPFWSSGILFSSQHELWVSRPPFDRSNLNDILQEILLSAWGGVENDFENQSGVTFSC